MRHFFYLKIKIQIKTNQSSPDTKFLDDCSLNNDCIFEFVGDNKQVGRSESCANAELLQNVSIK